MASAPHPRLPPPSRTALIAAVAAGLALIALAALIPTGAWAGFFAHPARLDAEGGPPDATRRGAAILRVMLVVLGTAIPAATWALGRRLPAPAAGRPPLRSRELWTIAGLVAVGAVLRIVRGTESLWYDEIAAWTTYGPAGPGAIAGNWFDPSNHVAHTLATWVSMRLFESGGAETALRLPALVFSLIAIVTIAGLARRAAGPRAGLLAAGLAALLPVCVLEGAEARGYSMMMAASAGSTWALLAGLEGARPRAWLLYAGATALGTWAHPLTALVAAGHALVLLVLLAGSRRAAALRGLGAVAIAGAASLTLWAPLIPDVLAARDVLSAGGGAAPGLLGAEGVAMIQQLGGAWSWWSLPGLALAALGLVFVLRDAPRRDAPHRLGAALALAGLPIFVLLVAGLGTWTYARFALFAIPGSILLIAIALDTLLARARLAGVAAGAAICAASAADLVTRPPKQPLRDAVDVVRAARAPGDRLLVIGLRHGVVSVYADDLPHATSLRHGADLEARLRDRPRWIIALYPRHVPAARMERLDREGYVIVADLPGWADQGNGRVLVMRRRDSVVAQRDDRVLPARDDRGIDAEEQADAGRDQE